jgi:lipoyl(octanoyl) transferase
MLKSTKHVGLVGVRTGMPLVRLGSGAGVAGGLVGVGLDAGGGVPFVLAGVGVGAAVGAAVLVELAVFVGSAVGVIATVASAVAVASIVTVASAVAVAVAVAVAPTDAAADSVGLDVPPQAATIRPITNDRPASPAVPRLDAMRPTPSCEARVTGNAAEATAIQSPHPSAVNRRDWCPAPASRAAVQSGTSRACYRGRMEERARPTNRASAETVPIAVSWLGRTPYREAWDLQHRIVAARADGRIGDQLLLLVHEPVLTLGRHSDPSHIRVSQDELAARHIETIRIERGGEVTYHGPGQLVAYPIIRLAERGLLIKPLVRALESALAETCRAFGVEAGPREGLPGCWTEHGGRKIGAVGVRVERGVSYHGIALNVCVRLSDFELIDACGMPDVESTSIARERDEAAEPPTESVPEAAAVFAAALAKALGVPLTGQLPPRADPRRARADLEALLAGAAAPSAVAQTPTGAR